MDDLRLNFQNPINGFYVEGPFGQEEYLPIADYNLIYYLSGKLDKGKDIITGEILNVLIATCWSHSIRISQGEANFHPLIRLTERSLERVISSKHTPKQFLLWKERIEKDSILENKNEISPECEQWINSPEYAKQKIEFEDS